MRDRTKQFLRVFITVLVAAFIWQIVLDPGYSTAKASESAVTVSDIDYDELTMKVHKNGNTIVYFSSDGRKTWTEVEGETVSDANGGYIIMDISWVSPSSNVTVYFKGNKVATALEVVFPKANSSFKVTFDKVNIDFEFDGNDDYTSFMWRKESDYNWMTVPFDTSSAGYKNFLKKINDLRYKGCKVVFICDQVIGPDAEHMGHRATKEVKISIPKLANAPSLKVNVKNLTINTKANMEYYNESTKQWVACTKNMEVAEIAPSVMYSSSKVGDTVKIKFRFAATEKKACSKTTVLTIPGQGKAPDFGDAGHVKVSLNEDKLMLTFTKASATTQIEYCVVKAGETFDPSKAKWSRVKKANKQVKLTSKKVPDKSTVYIRFAGVSANEKKNIELSIPSYYAPYIINWPKTTSESGSKT